MARAQFQKGQKVWVDCVGVWAQIEKVQPIWANGFAEPVKVTYDVGLGREFQAQELKPAAEEALAEGDLARWRLMRARNKWQTADDCQHHPVPGTYPVVVTDTADWGGWRVPGAEYDRDPHTIEFQARLIVAAPDLLALAERLAKAVEDAPENVPADVSALARIGRAMARAVRQSAATPGDQAPTHPEGESPESHSASQSVSHAA